MPSLKGKIQPVQLKTALLWQWWKKRKRKALIEGLKSLKEGYIPPILDLNLIDEVIEVREKEAFEMTKKLAQKEGIFVGPSSGAAMYVVLKIAERIKQGNIVTIFPDRGERYLSVLK